MDFRNEYWSNSYMTCEKILRLCGSVLVNHENSFSRACSILPSEYYKRLQRGQSQVEGIS